MKVFAGQPVKTGMIIVRQRGTKFRPGPGSGLGRDDTTGAPRRDRRVPPLGRKALHLGLGRGRSGLGSAGNDVPRPSAHPAEAGRGGDGGLACARSTRQGGGPDGGDGWTRGDVVVVVDPSPRDPSPPAGAAREGGAGGSGRGEQKHGADGEDAELTVPSAYRSSKPRSAYRRPHVSEGASRRLRVEAR